MYECTKFIPIENGLLECFHGFIQFYHSDLFIVSAQTANCKITWRVRTSCCWWFMINILRSYWTANLDWRRFVLTGGKTQSGLCTRLFCYIKKNAWSRSANFEGRSGQSLSFYQLTLCVCVCLQAMPGVWYRFQWDMTCPCGMATEISIMVDRWLLIFFQHHLTPSKS